MTQGTGNIDAKTSVSGMMEVLKSHLQHSAFQHLANILVLMLPHHASCKAGQASHLCRQSNVWVLGLP